jgi:GNAT superfamily N-acetyltransferase
MKIAIRELTDSVEDLDRLSRFYAQLYVAGFPDPDERESLENMKQYLRLKREGWYGENCYHILLACVGDTAVGAAVSDYLAIPNCGIIEFLLVDESARARRVGRTLHDAAIEAFDVDAQRIGKRGVDGIVIELNDPFRVPARDDNFDPFERAMIWDGWGYQRLCFPYAQPALSAGQEPVNCLLLAIKPIADHLRRGVSSTLVREIVEGYIRWAMRINEPEQDATFASMQRYLSKLSSVPIEPLSVYIGRDVDKPLSIRPVTSASDPAFKLTTDLYARAFPPGPTSIDVRMFEHALQWSAGRNDLHYHLWSLALDAEAPIAGMASFFVMPRFGFGGYLALEAPLRGSGRARMILKRAEEQIIRDEPEARIHYIECAPGSSEEAVFRQLGFTAVPVRYCQPPTDDEEQFGAGEGPELTLLYKRLGSDYDRTPFSPDEFLQALKVWLTEVYRLADPEASKTFQIARITLRMS